MGIKSASQKIREGGFSLVELLVVVVIIGILAAIAIPILNGQREKASASAVASDVRAASQVVSNTYAEVISPGDGAWDLVEGTNDGSIQIIGFKVGTGGSIEGVTGTTKDLEVRISPGTTYEDGTINVDGTWCLVFANNGQYAKITDSTNLEKSSSALDCTVTP